MLLFGHLQMTLLACPLNLPRHAGARNPWGGSSTRGCALCIFGLFCVVQLWIVHLWPFRSC
jgi:hypothetical protein